jgi:phosphate acetyltransferase
MTNLLGQLRTRAAKVHPTIVLPEGRDSRVVQAAGIVDDLGLARVILVGPKLAVQALADDHRVNLANIHIEDPTKSGQRGAVDELLKGLSFANDLSPEELQTYGSDPVHFGAALVALSKADAMVAGAATASSEIVRTAIRLVGVAAGSSLVSSIFFMVAPDGETALTYADCGVVPDPDIEQLAAIAADAARFHSLLTGHEPRVAFLSFSSHGSASHAMVEKVQAATQMFKTRWPDILADGELQVDAAIVPSVGRSKAPESPLEGRANVLIFPDLNAGNIGYKLTERLGGYTALGPLLQGLARPVHDLSRGCSVDDIVQIIAIAALQSAGEH